MSMLCGKVSDMRNYSIKSSFSIGTEIIYAVGVFKAVFLSFSMSELEFFIKHSLV